MYLRKLTHSMKEIKKIEKIKKFKLKNNVLKMKFKNLIRAIIMNGTSF